MSHVTAVEAKVVDLDALDAACKELGVTLVRGQRTHNWFGTWMNDWNVGAAAATQGYDPKTFGQCDHAIRVPGSRYEVGLVPSKDGTGYALVYDTWGPEGQTISRALGTGLDKLKVEYACAAGARAMARKGYAVKRQINPQTGRPQVVCMKR